MYEEFIDAVTDGDEFELWESDDDTEEGYRNELGIIKAPYTKLVEFICIFILSWQRIFRIPDIAVGILFEFISIVLERIFSILVR